jgi:CRP-like cAMP-binding protein
MGEERKADKPAVLDSLSKAWRVLEKYGWLSERGPAVNTALRRIARVRDFDAGQHLYVAGDRPNGMFALVSGALDISIPRADGQDMTVHRAEPGFWIGDSAFFSNQVRLVSVRAAVRSRVVHLPQARLAQLVRTKPEIVLDFYVLSHRNVETTLQLLGNLTVSSSEIRVALRLLLHDEKLPDGETWIRFSQETLAQLVALSVPTLQRALHKLEEARWIEVGYRRVRIVDRAGLLAFCGDVPLAAATG